ncbi:hypothetical protein BJX62DRAFT_237135 [Aspergillus germanicus]
MQKHVQPWQQILAFIVRTQAANEINQTSQQEEEEDGSQCPREWLGRLPVYSMTPRQRQKWQALWQLAMPVAPERPEPKNQQARVRARVIIVHTFAGTGQIIKGVWNASPSPSTSASTSPTEVNLEKLE